MAEGGGLLNRYAVISRIEGSNPSVSASACLSGFRPGDIGDNLVPNRLSMVCKALCSRSIYPRSLLAAGAPVRILQCLD